MRAETPFLTRPVPVSASAELGLVLRHLGGVQAHVSDLVRQQQQHIAQLQGQLMRLRAQRMLERTQRLWGLSQLQGPCADWVPDQASLVAATDLTEKPRRSLGARAWQAAQNIICQTGCVGHAHPWLQADGQCARTGQVCDVQPTLESRDVSEP